MKIDGIDKKIIKSLIEDARVPVLSIARNVGISGAAIHQRLRKLEKAGLISGYNLVLNSKSLGYNTTAFISIYLDNSAILSNVVKKLKEIPEILECYYTTGPFSLFIKILCKENEDLMHVLDAKIKLIPGIDRFESFLSLKEQIHRQIKL